MDDLFGLGKVSNNTVELIKMVYPDLAQPSVQKVGYALGDVLDFSFLALNPMRFQTEKVKLNFNKRIEEYREKIKDKNDKEIGKVAPEIGVPILENLTRTTNDDLAELFTSLLANASIIADSKYAHPQSLKILESIGGDEAKILNYLKQADEPIIFFRMDRIQDSINQTLPLTKKYTNIDDLVTLEYEANKDFYINNLSNLGIFNELDLYFNDMKGLYQSLETKHRESIRKANLEIMKLNEEQRRYGSSFSLKKEWGQFKLSYLGEMFLNSISVQN